MGSQADSMRFALDLFKNASTTIAAYNLVMFVRHDMVWTKDIDMWPRPADFSKFSFVPLCQNNQGGVDDWVRIGRSCVNYVMQFMPSKLFQAFDLVVGTPKCFNSNFRHGDGHECYEAVAQATGQKPGFATGYVPSGSVRRPLPLAFLIGTRADKKDQKRLLEFEQGLPLN